MEKIVRDGKTAVLTSPGYGAGWYSWHCKKELLFHPTLVELVEQGKQEEITEELCRELLGKDEYVCTLGADTLTIDWIKEGSTFKIEECDGFESIVTLDHLPLIA